MTELTRRHALQVGAAAVAVASMTRAAQADADMVNAALKELGLDGAEDSDLVSLDTPEIAENGNTVPVRFAVDSDMTEDNYVKRVAVLADGNPSAGVAVFHFSPQSGAAEAGTRIRLAKTQNIVAVAELSDGSMIRAASEVKVTIGGCGG